MQKNKEVDLGGKQDILQGKWRELKGLVKQQWGRLTDDDIVRPTDKRDELIGALQQRYGYGKEQAEPEINQWLRDHDAKHAGHVVTPGKV